MSFLNNLNFTYDFLDLQFLKVDIGKKKGLSKYSN